MFPCNAGSCMRAILTGVLLVGPERYLLAAESERVLINPLVTLGKLAIALIIVLFVFWVFAKVMRQVQGYQSGFHKELRVVAVLSVGQRERVIVVQVGEEQLVLGVTSSGISKIHQLERPLSQSNSRSEQGDFKSKLSAALKRQVPIT